MSLNDNKPHDSDNSDVIIIKKYANRRLYNMAVSHYITLEDIATIIRAGKNFVVYDVKTGDDITRSILTQIIVEQEAKGNQLLPMSFLLDMVKIYGNNAGGLVPDYWNQTMQIFKQNQEKLQKGFDTALGNVTTPLEQLRKVMTSNTQMFLKTIDIFNPNTNSNDTVTIDKQEYDTLLQEIARLRKLEKK